MSTCRKVGISSCALIPIFGIVYAFFSVERIKYEVKGVDVNIHNRGVTNRQPLPTHSSSNTSDTSDKSINMESD